MLTETPSFIYQLSWLTREVTTEWKLANVMPTYKKDWKENSGIYRLDSPISVLGKVMEQVILSGITRHVLEAQDRGQGLRARQKMDL